jgi:hypothetical protein
VALERGQSNYRSAECKSEMRERRQGEGVASRAAAWHFALDERLFQVLDNRLPVSLREPDLELVRRCRAAWRPG